MRRVRPDPEWGPSHWWEGSPTSGYHRWSPRWDQPTFTHLPDPRDPQALDVIAVRRVGQRRRRAEGARGARIVQNVWHWLCKMGHM